MTVRSNSASSNLYKLSATRADSVQLSCSSAAYGENCDFCPEGTYENGNNVCIPCSPGTSSNNVGLVWFTECDICHYNSYSNNEGSRYCKDCPKGKNCLIGATTPLTQFEFSDNFLSVQPVSYQPQIGVVGIIYYALYPSVTVAFILLVVVACSSTLRKKLEKFDKYPDKHNTPINEPVMQRKTYLGGTFTILFYMAALMVIAYGVLQYSINNITENKTLVPLILSESAICSPSLTITYDLFNYGDSCTEYVFSKESGMKYSQKYLNYSLQTNKNGKSCRIEIVYSNLCLNYTSTLLVELSELYSYAAYIEANITTVSSIPDQNSSIYYVITPDDPSTVFKGNAPTTINLLVTPSVT